MTIAVDPRTGELFVYKATTDLTQIQVSVFAAKASGNVPPLRTISGPATGITGPVLGGTNKMGISSDGRLFVAEPNRRILAFEPGASGNVAPSQVIEGSTHGSDAQGGIAVRPATANSRTAVTGRRDMNSRHGISPGFVLSACHLTLSSRMLDQGRVCADVCPTRTDRCRISPPVQRRTESGR